MFCIAQDAANLAWDALLMHFARVWYALNGVDADLVKLNLDLRWVVLSMTLPFLGIK